MMTLNTNLSWNIIEKSLIFNSLPRAIMKVCAHLSWMSRTSCTSR